MQSIFDLKKSVDQLESANNGIGKDVYEKLTPSRDVRQNNFSNGQISFKWNTRSSKWWCPSKTYLRMRIQVSDSAGTNSINREPDLAPCMNQMATLFQSAEFKINDKVVSSVNNFLAPIDTLDTRINKSRGWMDSVGASTNFWESYWHVRQSEIARDGEVYDGHGPALTFKETLGYDNTTTFSITTAGVMTFSAGPNTDTCFIQGDNIEVEIAGFSRFHVAQVGAGNRTLQLTTGPSANIVGSNLKWYRNREPNSAKATRYYEITWCPPLSIFKTEHGLPSGNFELTLVPHPSSVYQTISMESSTVAKTAGIDYKLTVEDMYLYINTLDGIRVDNTTCYLDLEQISCQADTIPTSAFQQRSFDIPPSTRQIAIAFQDRRAGTDTRYSITRFRTYTNSGFEANTDECLKLNRFFLNYAGISKPSPDSDPDFTPRIFLGTDNKDYTTQRYVDSLMASGGYHDTGGSETLEEWQRRGAYHLFNWSKDANDRSTRLSVHTQFNGADVTNARMLVFAVSSQICKLVISNGSISDVQVMDN